MSSKRSAKGGGKAAESPKKRKAATPPDRSDNEGDEVQDTLMYTASQAKSLFGSKSRVCDAKRVCI